VAGASSATGAAFKDAAANSMRGPESFNFDFTFTLDETQQEAISLLALLVQKYQY
jgi:hypothetical protein